MQVRLKSLSRSNPWRRIFQVRLLVETLEDRLPPGDVGFSTSSLIGPDLSGGDISSLTSENREFRLHRSLVETGSQQSVSSVAASILENQASGSETSQPVRTETPVLNPQQGSAFDAMTPKGASESALSAASSHSALHGRNAANIQPATSHHNGASVANNSDLTRHAHTAAPMSLSGSSGTAAQENTQRAFSLKSGGNIHSQGLTVYPTVRANSPVTCSPNSGLIQSETAIAVSGNVIVETYNDFRGFYCSNLGFQITGWAFSLDGGQTFTDGGPLPGRTNLGGDAEMAVAPDGSFYMATLYQPLSAAQVLHGVVNDSGTGIDWTAGPLINNAGGYDKENIAVDPNNGFIYLTYTRFGGPNGIWCTHSEDGGLTWINAVPVRIGNTPQLQGSTPVIGPNGEVYVAYQTGYPTSSGDIAFAVSYDNGYTFTDMGAIASYNWNPFGQVPGTDRTPTFPAIAVDTNVGSPNYGNIYIAYHSIADGQGDVLITSSNDGGMTWNPASIINPDFGPGQEWQPTLSVDAVGRVNAFFYSRRGETGNNTDLLFAQSTDGGNSFGSAIQVNEVPSNWHTSGDGTPTWGDYINSVSIGTDVYVAYADGRDSTPSLANPDAYLGHIYVPPPG